MQKFIGSLICLLGLMLLVFPEHIPIASQLLAGYWLRSGGGALVLLGGFLIWAAGGG